ncbi:MAG: phage tail protein [Candidatus Rokuibacteriota bacterium]
MPPRTSSHDPYRTFKFRVRLDDKTVAGVTKVSPLERSVTPTEVKEGGDLLGPRQNPGAVTYSEVTLERGLSRDKAFQDWANQMTKLHADPGSVKQFKRTVCIDVYDLDGNPTDTASRPVLTYKLHRCWVSKYVALPGLDGGADTIGIQSLSLRHEGWERLA